MACLAVDKDGTEWVWSYCPLRNKYRGVWDGSYYNGIKEGLQQALQVIGMLDNEHNRLKSSL